MHFHGERALGVQFECWTWFSSKVRISQRDCFSRQSPPRLPIALKKDCWNQTLSWPLCGGRPLVRPQSVVTPFLTYIHNLKKWKTNLWRIGGRYFDLCLFLMPRSLPALSFVSPKGTLHTEKPVAAKGWLGVTQLSYHFNRPVKSQEHVLTPECLQVGLQSSTA